MSCRRIDGGAEGWDWQKRRRPSAPTSLSGPAQGLGLTPWSEWRRAPTSREVHVWLATVERARAQARSLLTTFTPDEVTKLQGFRFERDRDLFLVARAMVRAVLSRYLRVPPERLCFHYGLYGKPALTNRGGPHPLRFNISHAHQLVVCAVASGRDIGIDVEHVRGREAYLQLGERLFSPSECSLLRSLPEDERPIAFLKQWTRKEAYLKARGEGLNILDRDGSTLPEPRRRQEERRDPSRRWCLEQLQLMAGYVGVVAVEGAIGEVRYWEWP